MVASVLVVVLAAGISLSEPATTFHQAGKAAPETRPNREAVDLSPGEVVGMLDAYALVQAQNALQLNDSQYGTFVGRLKNLQETRRRNQRARNQLVQDLRRMTNPQVTTVDEAAVREKLKALRELDDRSAAELRKAYDSLDEVLDVRQQARFRIFEENLERRKMDLLLRARQRAAGRRGDGGQ